MIPVIILSLIKWQSTYICFVLSRKIGFKERCKVGWLSHTSSIRPISQKWSSCSEWFNHKSLHVTWAMARYSASVPDRARISHVCEPKERKWNCERLRNIPKPKHVAQPNIPTVRQFSWIRIQIYCTWIIGGYGVLIPPSFQ